MLTGKRPVKVPNVKPLSLVVFFFALACERIFINTHSTERSCVTGPENMLFTGACVHLSARKLHDGAVKGLISDVRTVTQRYTAFSFEQFLGHNYNIYILI